MQGQGQGVEDEHKLLSPTNPTAPSAVGPSDEQGRKTIPLQGMATEVSDP